MQIVSCCYGEEFNLFATRFVAAINYHSPGQLVCLHVVNPPDNFSEQAAVLRQSARAIEIHFSTQASEKPGGKLELPVILEHLRKTDCSTLYLRIDSLVQKDLLIFLNRLHSISIAFPMNQYRDLAPPVLWVRHSRAALRFLNKAISLNLKNTTHLAMLLKQNKASVCQDLGADLVSAQRSDNGVIWCNAESLHVADARVNKLDNDLCQSFLSKKNIAVLTRRLDLPFKTGVRYTHDSALRRVHDSTRLYWQYFPKIIRDAHVLNKESVEIICLPHDKITPDFISSLPHDIIYLPHGNNIQFQDKRLFFYMQEIYPFFFTIDKKGWGSTSSSYQQFNGHTLTDCHQAEEFCLEIKQGKTTKYRQQTAPIPTFDVFFPLQIPDDDSLAFGSDHSLHDIVHAVINWAEQYKVRVLFKAHPIRPSLRYLNIKKGLTYARFIKTGDLHELLSRARVVFVANSGVGFEALLHVKPVVHFARAIYDVVATSAELSSDSIQNAYQTALSQDNLKQRYLQFIQWYIFNTGNLVKAPSVPLVIQNQRINVPVLTYCNEMASYKNLNNMDSIYSSHTQRYLRYVYARIKSIKKLFAQ